MSGSLARETLRPRARLMLAVSVAAMLAAVPATASDKLYGLIIGIDDYLDAVNHLDGAVNDAKGIADALEKVKADKVITIYDRAATKSAIQHAWYDLVHMAAAGDTIVISYAGHGGQEPQPPGWHEPNGKSDNFLLAGYRPSGAGSIERIVDWEMYQWLKAADDKGVQVIFVADSCHSGTMFRSIASKTVRYRQGKFADPDLASDLIKLPPPEIETAEQVDFKHVTYIGATQDNMLDPEIVIDGVPHGALSWAFAKAVASGVADTNHDGRLSQQELLQYLVPTVQTEADNQQIPSILPLRADAKPIMRAFSGDAGAVADAGNGAGEDANANAGKAPDTGGGAGAGADAGGGKAPPPPPPPPPAADQTTVHLLVRGGIPADLPDISGIAITDDEASADLIWDRAGHTLDSRVGGRVAENLRDADMPAILSKASALAFLKARISDSPVTLSLTSGNQTYKVGDTVDIAMSGVRLPYLTLFNLPPDGRVEFFWPLSDKETQTDWRKDHFEQSFKVDQPPFGAENMVAILTPEPALALHAALKAMPTAAKAGGLAAILRSSLAGKDFQAGVVGVFTTGGG
jgi:hypothetical protein